MNEGLTLLEGPSSNNINGITLDLNLPRHLVPMYDLGMLSTPRSFTAIKRQQHPPPNPGPICICPYVNTLYCHNNK